MNIMALSNLVRTYEPYCISQLYWIVLQSRVTGSDGVTYYSAAHNDKVATVSTFHS